MAAAGTAGLIPSPELQVKDKFSVCVSILLWARVLCPVVGSLKEFIGNIFPIGSFNVSINCFNCTIPCSNFNLKLSLNNTFRDCPLHVVVE